MDYARYTVLALALAASVSLLYALKPPYDELALNNAALAARLHTEQIQANRGAEEARLIEPCFDESLRAVSCNDLLIAQSATARATP